MERICESCGCRLEEGYLFCSNCGALTEQLSGTRSSSPDSKKPARKRNAAILAAAAAVLVAVGLLFLPRSGDDAEKDDYTAAVAAFMEVTVYGNTENIQALAPQEYWEKQAAAENIPISQVAENISKKFRPGYFSQDYQYEITYEEKCDEETTELLKDALQRDYGILPDRVGPCYAITAAVTRRSSTSRYSLHAIRIDDTWYVTRCFLPYTFEDAVVRFLTI